MYLTIDIGATKTLLAVFTKSGKLTEQHKFPTPAAYHDLIKAIDTERTHITQNDFERAIVAVPGRLDRKRGVAVAFGNRDWRNVPIQHDLEKILHIPVIIENDAKLAALSEAILIKSEFNKALYITISTGISAGLVVNGVIDPSLADSESGQMWFDHDGKYQQWEDFASGRAIVAKYNQRASEISDPKIWSAIAHDLAIGFIQLIAIIQPQVIILGGGVGAHFSKFKQPLLKELHALELPIIPIPPIRAAKHPEEAVIYGCYELARQRHG